MNRVTRIFFLFAVIWSLTSFQNCSDVSPNNLSSDQEITDGSVIQMGPGNGDFFDGKASYVYWGSGCDSGRFQAKIYSVGESYFMTREACRDIEPRPLKKRDVSLHDLGIAFRGQLFLSSPNPSQSLNEIIIAQDISQDEAKFTLQDLEFYLQCRLNQGPLESCSREVFYSSVSTGEQLFYVQAVDASGLKVADQSYAWSNGYKIVLSGDGRRWSDGSYATSCNAYRNPESDRYVYSGETGDGIYSISLLGNVVDVYCDMTREGGGWTRVISADTRLGDLESFGNTNKIKSSFYVNSERGLGWGVRGSSSSSWNERKFTVKMNYQKVALRFSGKFNDPQGGLGRLDIFGDRERVLRFSDSHRYSSEGQNLSVRGGASYQDKRRNELNRLAEVEFSGVQAQLEIVMATFSNQPYTRRYIQELWLK